MFVPYPTGLEPKLNRNDPALGAKRELLQKYARRMILMRFLADFGIGALFLLFAIRTGSWQVYRLAILVLPLLAIDLLGFYLVRRDRFELGATLVIGGLLVIQPVIVSLVSGLGIVLAISVILVTALSGGLALPSRRASRLFLLSLLVGLAAALLDNLLPSTGRFPVPPEFRTLIPLLVGLLLLVYVVLLARQFAQFTLRTKLVNAFLIIALLPLAVLAFLNERANRAALTEAASQALFASASKTASSVDNFLANNLNNIQSEAQLPVFRQFLLLDADQRSESVLLDEVVAVLESLQSKDPKNLLNYALLDREALVVADTAGLALGKLPPFMAIDESFMNDFRLVLLTDLPSVTPVKFWPQTGRASLYFSARISDLEGKPLGAILAQYDAAILQDLVLPSNGLAGEDSFGVLFDEFFIHLAHGEAPETIYKAVAPLDQEVLERLLASMRLPPQPQEALSTNLPELEQNLANSEQEPFFMAGDVATGDRVNQVAVARLENQPWLVAFFQPDDIFLAPIERQTRLTLLLAAVITSLVVLAALGASQLVASPILRLTEVAVRVAEGELTSRAQISSGDEIGTLASTFNRMTDRLQHTLRGLEEQVDARTMDLERRALQLQTAAQVAQEAAAVRDFEQLLQLTTEQISASFGYYHCGIFLFDERREFAVLQAASSEGGQKMLSKGHKLPVGKQGIVGHVASSGEPRIALDVGGDAVYFDNPDLPATRSEMALALKVQGEVIGILDVQSTQASAFKQEDVEVLQILADQIALAIENTHLLSASQESLQELEALYRQQVQSAWRHKLADKSLAFRYDRLKVEAVEPYAPSSGQDLEMDDSRLLRVPISLRGQPIGALNLKRTEDKEPWSPEESELAREIAHQLGLALENSRLYEETQLQAELERLTSEVSSKMRETLDIDTVLKTAAIEIQRAMNLDHVQVKLGLDQPADGNGAAGGGPHRYPQAAERFDHE